MNSPCIRILAATFALLWADSALFSRIVFADALLDEQIEEEQGAADYEEQVDEEPADQQPADEEQSPDSAGEQSPAELPQDSAADSEHAEVDDSTTVSATAAETEEVDEPATEVSGEAEQAENSSSESEVATETESPSASSTAPAPPVSDDNASSAILAPAARHPKIESAMFKGMRPGESTAEELTEAWGPPTEERTADGVDSRLYQIEPFPRIIVTLTDNVISSIVVVLDKPARPQALAEQLNLKDVASIHVFDEQGQVLGEAFPERGVLFGYKSHEKKPRVAQVVMEPLSAQPFLLRAELNLPAHYAQCLCDVNCALELDPKSAEAQALRARLYRQAGDLPAALKAAQAAVALEPEAAEWRLTLAKIYLQTADFKRAQQELESVLSSATAEPLAKARAHLILGDCVALNPARSEKPAIDEHREAIKLAERFAADPAVEIRRSAKEILLDAHLRMAHDIGWGNFQHKTLAISKWLERASGLAKDLVENEGVERGVLARVNEQALAALAGIGDPPSAAKLADAAIEQVEALVKQSTDEAYRAQLQWHLALALCDAVQIERARGEYEQALEYGEQAATCFEKGDVAGRQLPHHDYLFGQFNYRVGAIHAIGKQQHADAIPWYDRAVKLLETPVPASHQTDPGQHGETFVSMAISYWQAGQREEALRLTKQGTKLMEQAVEDGFLPKAALGVAYGNLSSMHGELGDQKLAKKFAEMAVRHEGIKR